MGIVIVFLLVFLAVVMTVGVVALIATIFYLGTLQKALSRVSPRNRLMEPAYVWLLLIPCFNLFWQFMIAIRVPESLRNEFRERGRDDGSDYGKTIALMQAILVIGALVTYIGMGLSSVREAGPCVVGLMSLMCWGLFIFFWVKVANYSNQLATDDKQGRDLKQVFDAYDGSDHDKPRDGSSDPTSEKYRPDAQGYHP